MNKQPNMRLLFFITLSMWCNGIPSTWQSDYAIDPLIAIGCFGNKIRLSVPGLQVEILLVIPKQPMEILFSATARDVPYTKNNSRRI